MNHWVVTLLRLALVVVPLTEGQRVRLDTAIDGRDHREEAFIALLENVRAWEAQHVPGGAPVILQPDVEAMLAAPDQWRGALCRLEGVIQQRTILDRPYRGVAEWFVRDAGGRPLLVFVAAGDPDELARFRDGQRITTYGRFYKRVDAMARDNERRAYAAFVASPPDRPAVSAGPGGVGMLVAIALPVGGLLLIFLVVLIWSRRAGQMRRTGLATRGDAAIEVDDGAALPDDPCEALAELKRRAEDRS